MVKSDALLFYFFGTEQFLWDCEAEALDRILLSRFLNRNKYKARYLLPKEGMPEHNLQVAYIPQRSGSSKDSAPAPVPVPVGALKGLSVFPAGPPKKKINK